MEARAQGAATRRARRMEPARERSIGGTRRRGPIRVKGGKLGEGVKVGRRLTDPDCGQPNNTEVKAGGLDWVIAEKLFALVV
jgi:hypothetical protein